MPADLNDPADPTVVDALTRICKICGAAHGLTCRNLQGGPFSGGHLVHMARPK